MRKALPQKKVTEIYDRSARRYDWLHSLITARADKKGRRILVDKIIREGDYVLDAGAGTGSTSVMAAQKSGTNGKVVMLDISEGMLDKGKEKAEEMGLQDRIEIHRGNMMSLPFDDGTFDCTLSTYSLDPLNDPSKAALELYRVTKSGGKIGIAHLSTPKNPVLKWLGDKIEGLVWHFSSISLGCRPIDVLPALEKAGARLIYLDLIGVPLWPFRIIIVEKPE
jgi:ubiquinone/menaquinone biosynthesis C-methylase UbiE